MAEGRNLLKERLEKRREEKDAEEQRLKESQRLEEEQNEVDRLRGLIANNIRSDDYKRAREIYEKILQIRPDDHEALWGICECDKKEDKDAGNKFMNLGSVDEFVSRADDVLFVEDKLAVIEKEYQDEFEDLSDKKKHHGNALSDAKRNLQNLNNDFGKLKDPKKAKRLWSLVTGAVLVIILFIARYSLELEEMIDNIIFFSLVVMVCWMSAFLMPFLVYYHGSTKVDDDRDEYLRQIGYMDRVVEAEQEWVRTFDEKISSLDNRMKEIRDIYYARPDAEAPSDTEEAEEDEVPSDPEAVSDPGDIPAND